MQKTLSYEVSIETNAQSINRPLNNKRIDDGFGKEEDGT